MDYEILTCSPILHEQEFPLEILTESETPNKEDSITNGMIQLTDTEWDLG